MRRLTALSITALAVVAGLLSVSGPVLAQGRVKQHGRAQVDYRSEEVIAVAAYEYSQLNHTGAWLLIEFALQTKQRIVIRRDQITLLTPDERVVPIATQQQFLDDSPVLTQLMQNAGIWRRPLGAYFRTPLQGTIRFFSLPGRGVVHDSAVTNLDEVAAGDLLFKSPDGSWKAGTYRLRLNHDQAKAELPIVLE
jgi:hypothetical protein